MCTDKMLFNNINRILLIYLVLEFTFFPLNLGRSQLLPGTSYKVWALVLLTVPLSMGIQVVSGFLLLQTGILGISSMILLSWPSSDLLSVPRCMGTTGPKESI